MKKIILCFCFLILPIPIKAIEVSNGEVEIPIGTIQSYSGSTIPEGYLEASGQAVSRTTYKELFDVIKTTYGAGDGKTTFNLPNLNGRVITGYNSKESEFNTLGKTGGSKSFNNSHTHTIASHTHSISAHTHTIASHSHSIPAHTHNIPSHTHTTANHTLTIAEMPSHDHKSSTSDVLFGIKATYVPTQNSGWGMPNWWLGQMTTTSTGGGGAHNHGNTGSTSLITNENVDGLTTNGTSLTTDKNADGLTTGESGVLTTESAGNSNQSLLQPYIVLKYMIKAK